jgi:hypothetical protein
VSLKRAEAERKSQRANRKHCGKAICCSEKEAKTFLIIIYGYDKSIFIRVVSWSAALSFGQNLDFKLELGYVNMRGRE